MAYGKFSVLFTYIHLEAQIFLREEAPDIPTIVPWCGSLRNMLVSHTVPREERFECEAVSSNFHE